jgi:hypothetical protein
MFAVRDHYLSIRDTELLGEIIDHDHDGLLNLCIPSPALAPNPALSQPCPIAAYLSLTIATVPTREISRLKP